MIAALQRHIKKYWLGAAFMCVFISSTTHAIKIKPFTDKDTTYNLPFTTIGLYAIEEKLTNTNTPCANGFQSLPYRDPTNACAKTHLCVSSKPIIPHQAIFAAHANAERFSLTGPQWNQQLEGETPSWQKLQDYTIKHQVKRLAITDETTSPATVIGVIELHQDTRFTLRIPIKISLHLEDKTRQCKNTLQHDGESICLQENNIPAAFVSAQAGVTVDNKPMVMLNTHNDDTNNFHKITSKNIGNRLAILTTKTNALNEETHQIISLAIIRSQLGNQFMITGLGRIDEANTLAIQINAGINKKQEMSIIDTTPDKAVETALAKHINVKINKPIRTFFTHSMRTAGCWFKNVID
jgi:hypothetical protein